MKKKPSFLDVIRALNSERPEHALRVVREYFDDTPTEEPKKSARGH